MFTKFSLTCITVVLMAAGLACSRGNTETIVKKQDAVPVTVTAVAKKNIPLEVHAIGNVEAYSTIGVKAQIGGQLVKVYFQEGDSVKKDDPLFDIDSRPYEEAIKQAEANIARDQAQLKQAEANLARDIAQEKYARDQETRYSQLFAKGVLSREQTDQVRTDADAKGEAVRADHAAIDSAAAAINADRSSLENAKLNFAYCKIRSPIDGRTGNLNVKQGNLVKANDIDMVTINQILPIYVTFSVPENQLPAIKKYMAGTKLQVFANPPSESKESEHQGALTFIDNSVDGTTGTIKLKGTFSNTDGKLWPGQFVNVTLRLAMKANAIVVPTQTVQTGQNGSYVFVVKPDMTVEVRDVVVDAALDQELEIAKGLEAGETVVTEGQLRLAKDTKVQFKKTAK